VLAVGGAGGSRYVPTPGLFIFLIKGECAMEKIDQATVDIDVSLEVLVETLSWGLQWEFFAFIYNERLHPNIENSVWVDNEPHHPVFKIVMRYKPGSELGLDIWISNDGFVEVFLCLNNGGKTLDAFRVDGTGGLNAGRRIGKIAEKYFPQKNGSVEHLRLIEEFWNREIDDKKGGECDGKD